MSVLETERLAARRDRRWVKRTLSHIADSLGKVRERLEVIAQRAEATDADVRSLMRTGGIVEDEG